jgi:protein-tyrosine phosphatase
VRNFRYAAHQSFLLLVSCLCIVIQHPIVEGGSPPSMDAFVPIVGRVLSLLSSGASILCHCRGGVGRAGLFASCVLLAAGVSALPSDAIAMVRKRR